MNYHSMSFQELITLAESDARYSVDPLFTALVDKLAHIEQAYPGYQVQTRLNAHPQRLRVTQGEVRGVR